MVDFVLYTWPELIYLIACFGFCVPMMRLVFYHVNIVLPRLRVET